MSLRSVLFHGLALAAVTGVLLGGAVPAGAADGPVPAAQQPDGTGGPDGQAGGRGDRDPRRYDGVVTAKGGIWLHDRPDRGTRRVRFAEQGEHVSIYCKVNGDRVSGNPLWYLLTDGTWAWASARYIGNVGPAPRWC
ncbi:SH3 domain-containing protein [Streptomyces sp. NPDC048208]|uniref:SH3 domain-containing protein n=1 Tax=unclassified Streptomyces TaxID=2593676 RepID=UPI00136AA6B0|nr:SH3 domain-containing protein [Streptomyces sp. SID4982]MYS15543.1 SH3 domain-containing protein [Streptomyces sp. SID4982]